MCILVNLVYIFVSQCSIFVSPTCWIFISSLVGFVISPVKTFLLAPHPGNVLKILHFTFIKDLSLSIERSNQLYPFALFCGSFVLCNFFEIANSILSMPFSDVSFCYCFCLLFFSYCWLDFFCILVFHYFFCYNSW